MAPLLLMIIKEQKRMVLLIGILLALCVLLLAGIPQKKLNKQINKTYASEIERNPERFLPSSTFDMSDLLKIPKLKKEKYPAQINPSSLQTVDSEKKAFTQLMKKLIGIKPEATQRRGITVKRLKAKGKKKYFLDEQGRIYKSTGSKNKKKTNLILATEQIGREVYTSNDISHFNDLKIEEPLIHITDSSIATDPNYWYFKKNKSSSYLDDIGVIIAGANVKTSDLRSDSSNSKLKVHFGNISLVNLTCPLGQHVIEVACGKENQEICFSCGYCGDGITKAEFAEECDDGNQVDNDNCTNTCTLPVCGDGLKQENEQCDDGNEINTDTCTNACKLNGFDIEIVSKTCTSYPCSIQCPDGKQVLSGGVQWLSTNGTCHLGESKKYGNGWIGNTSPTNSDTTYCQFAVRALCANLPEGSSIETVRSNCNTSSSSNCSAACPQGSSLLGGGVDWRGTNGTCHVSESRPSSANSWSGGTSATNSATSSCSASVEAYCLNSSLNTNSTIARTSCGQSRTSACGANCSEGSYLVGGGVDWLGTNGTCHVYQSYPNSLSSWVAGISATNSQTSSCSAAVEAVCLNIN